jgi:hypothetical protein
VVEEGIESNVLIRSSLKLKRTMSLYSECDDDELFPLEVREMGYDYAAYIVAVQSSRESSSSD